jgi:hypothetical protein
LLKRYKYFLFKTSFNIDFDYILAQSFNALQGNTFLIYGGTGIREDAHGHQFP